MQKPEKRPPQNYTDTDVEELAEKVREFMSDDGESLDSNLCLNVLCCNVGYILAYGTHDEETLSEVVARITKLRDVWRARFLNDGVTGNA